MPAGPRTRLALALGLALAVLGLLPALAAAREPIISYIEPGKFGLYDEETEQDLPSPAVPVPTGAMAAAQFKYGMSLDGRYIAYLDAAKKIHLFDRAIKGEVPLPGIDVNADPNFLTVSNTGLVGFDNNGNGPTRVYNSITKQLLVTGLAPVEANNKHRQSKLSGNGWTQRTASPTAATTRRPLCRTW